MNSIFSKYFSQFFFFFAIFFAMPIPPLLNGETILTTGTENATIGAGNIQSELFFTQMVPITYYNAADQCQLQPGNNEVLPMSLVFFLPNDAMNDGSGITICYKGQLDASTNLEYGLISPIGMRVVNLAQNEVAQICGNLHGFTLKGGSNGGKFTLTMSTTMNRFVIDLAQHHDGILVLKLARWNSLISHFDKQMSNDRSRNRNHPTFLDISGDWALQKAYFHDVFAGAKLAEYFGPWALGADMLPGEYAADAPFELFVNRSSCSEMFKLSSEPSNLEFMPPKRVSKGANVTSKESAVITKNTEILVRGKVVGHHFFFQIRLAKRAIGMKEILAFRMNFEFNEKNGKKKASIQMERFNNTEWAAVDSPKFDDKLWPNKQFMMKAVYRNYALEVSINCGPFQKYSLGLSKMEKQMLKMIKDANEYKFIFKGGVEINSVLIGGKQLDEWTVGETILKEFVNVTILDRYGIFVRAELLPDPKWAIKIELAPQDSNGTSYTFEANSTEIKFPSGEIIPNDGQIKAGSLFEGLFILKENHFNTILNEGEKVSDSIKFVENKFKVKIDANFDTDSLTFNQSFAPPGQFNLENDYFEKGAKIVFIGKIPKYSHGFTLDFIEYGKDGFPAIGKCITFLSCNINLRISADFGNQTTEFMQTDTTGNRELGFINVKRANPNPFYPGMEFQMLIQATTQGNPGYNIAIQDGGKGDIWLPIYTFPSQNIKTRGIEINGEIFSIGVPGMGSIK